MGKSTTAFYNQCYSRSQRPELKGILGTVHLPNFSAAMRRSDYLCNYQFNKGFYNEIQAHLTMHMDVEVFSKILILTQHRPFW